MGRDTSAGRSRKAVASRRRTQAPLLPEDRRQSTLDHPPTENRSAPRGSLLDPWEPEIDALLARYPLLSAARFMDVSSGQEVSHCSGQDCDGPFGNSCRSFGSRKNAHQGNGENTRQRMQSIDRRSRIL